MSTPASLPGPQAARASATPKKPALYALVTVRWADSVLATKRLGDGAEATVGAALSTLLPLPCESLGVPAVVVATVRDGVPTAFVPRGAVGFRERPQHIPSPLAGPSELVLAAGETVSFAIDGFLITISADEVARAPWAALSPLRSSFGPAPHVAVAALGHALLIGLSAQSAFAASFDEGSVNHDDARRFLASAEERSSVSESITTDVGVADLGKNVNERNGNGTDGGGARAKGPEGAMGARDSRVKAQQRSATSARPSDALDGAMTREEAIADARSFGMVGVLAAQRSRPTFASYGDVAERARDPFDAHGAMWSTSIGETFGVGGLGLSGTGESGGGSGIGIGLGEIGMFGHTSGRAGFGTGGGGGPLSGGWGGASWWGGSHYDGIGIGRVGTIGTIGHGRAEVYDLNPRKLEDMRTEEVHQAKLPPDAIRRIVQQSSGRFRACYQSALRSNPSLAGGVTTRFLIGADGHVKTAVNAGSDLPDATAVACITRAFYGLAFPEPPGGAPVTVTYPFTFSPDR